MKPDFSYKLPVDADLSFSSYISALSILENHHPKELFDFYWYHIFVASQNFAIAHQIFSFNDRYSIEIDFSYKPDEWSLEIVGYTFKDKKTIKAMVHTEGA